MPKLKILVVAPLFMLPLPAAAAQNHVPAPENLAAREWFQVYSLSNLPGVVALMLEKKTSTRPRLSGPASALVEFPAAESRLIVPDVPVSPFGSLHRRVLPAIALGQSLPPSGVDGNGQSLTLWRSVTLWRSADPLEERFGGA